MELTYGLVKKYKGEMEFKSKGLATLAAYLYFINTGKVHCGDHGHFRPNHSAGFSYELFKILDFECTTANNTHIIRLIKQQLPSFAD